jgi:hypothetical protein
VPADLRARARAPAARWLVLGFDARESPQRVAGTWNPERRANFLCRLDAESPLSVDTGVWPSLFERFPGRLPAWTGRVQGLWADLTQLREAVRGIEDLCLVAVAVDRASCSQPAEKALEQYLRGVTPEGEPGPYPEPHEIAQPHTLDSGWDFLGCDVADFLGVSGLSNAGFLSDRENAEALRKKWGSRLNRFHLFDDLADARAFRAFADQRVSEHAPFFVMGLWRVPA